MIKICAYCGKLIGKAGMYSYVTWAGGSYHKDCLKKLKSFKFQNIGLKG